MLVGFLFSSCTVHLKLIAATLSAFARFVATELDWVGVVVGAESNFSHVLVKELFVFVRIDLVHFLTGYHYHKRQLYQD